MSSKEDKDFSLVICSTLDNLGFKKENISFRSKFSSELTSIGNSLMEKFSEGATMINAGSFAEGVQLSDSDNDAMCVFKDIVCLDHVDVDEHFIILATDYTNTAPGYTKIVSLCDSSINTARRNTSLFSTMDFSFGRFLYLSSTGVTRNNVQDMSAYYKEMRFENVEVVVSSNGPALTTTGEISKDAIATDSVFSIYFYGDKHLHRWSNRTRNYTWPPKDIIKEISEMEGYIVPVGDKQSENQDLEWRICFTTAEKKLVSHLSDTQIKLYVLLKLLSKHVLKPMCKALTSYVMKNVVFWITETTPQEVFSPDNLLHLVLKSLHFIKYCFENNHFPNYMIPERNIFRGAVCDPEKKSIIKFLSECLKEGRHVILRIPKLYDCMSLMVKHPEIMITYDRWRDEVEKRSLDYRRKYYRSKIQSISYMHPCVFKDIALVNDPICLEAGIKFSNLVMPLAEMVSMRLKGKSGEDIRVIFDKRMGLINIL